MLKRLVPVFLLLLISPLILSAQDQPAEQSGPRNILIIYSYNQAQPWTISFQDGLDLAAAEYNINYFIEYLDILRLGERISDEQLENYLSEKYKSIKFDAVIADSAGSSRFVNNTDTVFAGIPKVLYPSQELEEKPDSYYFSSQFYTSIQKTVKLALLQNSEPSEIIVIDGTNGQDEGTITSIEEVTDHELTLIQITTIEELESTVKSAGPDSIIFFFLVFSDENGNIYIPKEIAARLASISEAPIYSFWTSLMNSGIVGGYMLDSSLTASEMVRASFDYIENGSFSDGYNNLQPVIDWTALKKYKLDRKDLPENTVFLNKPVSFFENYYRELTIGIFFIIAVFLIISLYWNKRISIANRELFKAKQEVEEARHIAENLARTDHLTSLMNRRAILPVITNEMNRNNRFGTPVSMILIDIDNFKEVNDLIGHDVGDIVLTRLASTFSDICRNTDSIARWGGEEFLVIAANTIAESAIKLAEKIRKSVIALKFDKLQKITVSAGVAEYHNEETFEQWFKRADLALYDAKSGGRNKTSLNEKDKMKEKTKTAK